MHLKPLYDQKTGLGQPTQFWKVFQYGVKSKSHEKSGICGKYNLKKFFFGPKTQKII